MSKPGVLKYVGRLALASWISFSTVCTQAPAQSTFPPEYKAGRNGMDMDLDAYEIFYMMYDQSIDLKARDIYVVGTDRKIPVTFGAEKEGSSSKILRVLSPSKDHLGAFLVAYADVGVETILNFLNGRIREKNVLDQDGNLVSLDEEKIAALKKVDWRKYAALKGSESSWQMSIESVSFTENIELGEEYKAAVREFLSLFPQAPFSFFKMSARQNIFQMQTQANGDNFPKLIRYYDSWDVLYGEPQKYVFKGHKELNKGWEVIFKPQSTYADFEKQMMWFRKLMGNKTQLFEAPGHQRVVMPSVQLAPWQEKEFSGKAAELNRMLQAYIVLRGLKGQTGLLGAKHKSLITDGQFAHLNTGRGPIRLEKDRFYKNSIGIEFRTGMKDEVVRRFVQAVYASRFATNQLGDLAKLSDWTLVPSSFMPVAEKLQVDPEKLQKALENWSQLKGRRTGWNLEKSYMVPLWQWENAPFLQGKKGEIIRLRNEFVNALAEMQEPNLQKVSKLLSQWVAASNLITDIEKYMAPKKSIDRTTSPLMVDVPKGGVDVNKIDLGNEFTARMPLNLKARYDESGKWTQTIFDMTPQERENRIRSVAESLKENFTGTRDGVSRLDSGSHGHNLSIAYQFKDKLGRDWRVEWDGVGRNYDTGGEIVEGSARGGHIEIVSPKYNPTMEEIQAVYDMMEKESLIPDYKMGGSHINIDFEVFEKNPKALARFLSLFHKHRGIISFMFQHINRLRSAEPVEVTPYLDNSLKHFNGTKDDLAKLLYNERYFNQRVNRKTRYTQIDVSNYMGQAIPAEFLKPDFDVVKARFTGGDGWSRQFRVTKYKKLEFRLFDAPKDPLEAALQIKVVRAMMNQALNSSAPIQGEPQVVDHEFYVKNPHQAYEDLKNLSSELNLNYVDYSPYVTNKIVINGTFMKGRFYQNWFQRADREFPRQGGWKQAENVVRSGGQILYSDRKLTPPATASVVGIRCEKVHRVR